jgi:hypothetical protein
MMEDNDEEEEDDDVIPISLNTMILQKAMKTMK